MMQPLGYQKDIVDGLSGAIGRETTLAVSLAAPAGSGKTLMLALSLERARPTVPVIWIWLAPFEAIVAQTWATIADEVQGLRVRSLLTERRKSGFVAGEVYLGTSQLVSNPKSSVHQPASRTPTLTGMVEGIRQVGYRLGIVLDEAHIGVDEDTELGRRIAAYAPDFVLAATATPRDRRLGALLSSMGRGNVTPISVSRQDVVEQGLNKSFLTAVRLMSGGEDVALQRQLAVRAMAYHAMRSHEAVSQAFKNQGVTLTPLILAQADNGNESAALLEAAFLEAGVPASAIRKYLEDDRAAGKLAELGADPSVKILIFKVAAGTGFDAPRASILVSDRTVQDRDSAVQYIGRVMRIPSEVRAALRNTAIDPGDARIMKTAFLFTRGTGQQAFNSAADIYKALSTEIDFTSQDLTVLAGAVSQPGRPEGTMNGAPMLPSMRQAVSEWQQILPGMSGDDASIRFKGTEILAYLDHTATEQVIVPSGNSGRRGPKVTGYGSMQELEDDLLSQGLKCWHLKNDADVPASFVQEEWPLLSGFQELTRRFEKDYQPARHDIDRLAPLARGEWKGITQWEELFDVGALRQESFALHTPRVLATLADRAARERFSTLRALSDSGSQNDILKLIGRKLIASGTPILTADQLKILALLMVPSAMVTLTRTEAKFLSEDVASVPSRKLPDLLVLPAGVAAAASRRVIAHLGR